jgi:hypothetical protein
VMLKTYPITTNFHGVLLKRTHRIKFAFRWPLALDKLGSLTFQPHRKQTRFSLTC